MGTHAASDTHSWCLKSLEKLTGYSTSRDIVNYILSIESEDELRDFLNGILTPLDEEKKQFINQLVLKIDFGGRRSQLAGNMSVETFRLSQKQQNDEPVMRQKSKKKRNRNNVQEIDDISVNTSTESTTKTLPKYVPLFDASGNQSVILLPGRHLCDCQATRHKLIRNCLSCGRIVCEQERAGPCLFCGDFVASREEVEAMKRVSQKGKKIYENIMKVHNIYLKLKGFPPISTELPEAGPPVGGFRKESVNGNQSISDTSETLQSITASLRILDSDIQGQTLKSETSESSLAAIEFKDRLLNYDRTSSKRTQVIDDESDYFGADLWQSPEERARLRIQEERLREQKKTDERSRVVTIDVLGRNVTQSVNNLSVYERAKMEDEASQVLLESREAKEQALLDAGCFPTIQSAAGDVINAPTFVPQQTSDTDEVLKQSYLQVAKENFGKGLKLQDSFLQEMTDEGLCLSMHQPWASLLVAGIKRLEGRDWYTTHRGRLWIASTGKPCSQETIASLEQSYKVLRNDDFLPFPQQYPTGCLLGCVEVVDCLTQEQFTQEYSTECEECSDSSYVWVCENPHQLDFQFPVIGQPKIWKLQPEKHKAAKKTLKL
ncbi:activating signal cointegrator 1-like [Convolutriloba macropyga]|uniref:activating signal cointegrator 1-like n=1 Tax=Convolutriloba macropyga TaxID=536237 RepID=UPI003F521166